MSSRKLQLDRTIESMSEQIGLDLLVDKSKHSKLSCLRSILQLPTAAPE